jgi:hypothetical protein
VSRNLLLPRPHSAGFGALSPTDSLNGAIKVSLCKALPLKWHGPVFLLQNEARYAPTLESTLCLNKSSATAAVASKIYIGTTICSR